MSLTYQFRVSARPAQISANSSRSCGCKIAIESLLDGSMLSRIAVASCAEGCIYACGRTPKSEGWQLPPRLLRVGTPKRMLKGDSCTTIDIGTAATARLARGNMHVAAGPTGSQCNMPNCPVLASQLQASIV